MRKPPASRSPKPAPTNSAPSPRRPARHRADQGPVRNQRTGPFHTTLVVKPNDAVIGKINDGQHFDWVAALEHLFQDDDLSDLFDVTLDGVEDPEDEQNRLLGMGDYRPAAWFRWFGGSEPRDPRRPFRR